MLRAFLFFLFLNLSSQSWGQERVPNNAPTLSDSRISTTPQEVDEVRHPELGNLPDDWQQNLDSFNDDTNRNRLFAKFGINLSEVPAGSVSVYRDGKITPVTNENFLELVSESSVIVQQTGNEVIEHVDENGEQRYALPFTFKAMVTFREEAARVIEYSPFVFPRGRLRYYGDRKAYVAKIGVGVWERNPTGQRPLRPPVRLSLASGSFDEIIPLDLTFNELNTLQDVEVSISTLDGEPNLSVRPDFLRDSYDVPIRIGPRPVLEINTDGNSMMGFGLEASAANIQVKNIVNPSGFAVQLKLEPGWIDTSGLVGLNESGAGSLQIRSAGIGCARLWSEDTVFASVVEERIEFKFPLLFLLASIVGGFAGAVATRIGRSSWRTRCAAATVGIIVVVASAVGINLVPMIPVAKAGEALAFVLAALGAASGCKVLERWPPFLEQLSSNN